MSRASSSVSRRLGIGVICCTCSSWPSLGHLSCSRSKTKGRPCFVVVVRGEVLLLEGAVGQRCAGADCAPSARGNRNWPSRLRGSGWRRTCRPASAPPSPMEWQAMQPRVSKASLPFSGSPGFCCGSSPGHAGLPDERRDGLDLVIVQAEGGHLGAFAPVVRILQPDRNPLLVQLHAHFFQAGPDLLDFAHQARASACRAARSWRRGRWSAPSDRWRAGYSFLASVSLVRGLLAFCSSKPASRIHSAFCCSSWRIC